MSEVLLAVILMVDSDHEVRIESENCDGGMAVHEMTGSVTKFVRRDNVFEVKRYVMPYSQSPNGMRQVSS